MLGMLPMLAMLVAMLAVLPGLSRSGGLGVTRWLPLALMGMRSPPPPTPVPPTPPTIPPIGTEPGAGAVGRQSDGGPT